MRIPENFKDNIFNVIDNYKDRQNKIIDNIDIKELITNIKKIDFENKLDLTGNICIIINEQILNLLKDILNIYIRCGLLQLDYSLYPFLQNYDIQKINKEEIMYLFKQIRNKIIIGTDYEKFQLDMSDWCLDENSKNLPKNIYNAIAFLERILYFKKQITNIKKTSNIQIYEF